MHSVEGLNMRILALEIHREEDQKTVGNLVEAIHGLTMGLSDQNTKIADNSLALTVFTSNLETKFNTMFKTLSICAVVMVTLSGAFFGYQTYQDNRYVSRLASNSERLVDIEAKKVIQASK